MKRIGICHICGEEKELTFEHIPPQKAFNNRPVITLPFNKAIHIGPDSDGKGKKQQKGMGGYTLCYSCNNNTGQWYANDFIQWCYYGMHILERTSGNPTLFNCNYIFPLRVIKQIVAMLLSSAHAGFSTAEEELRRFVLNRERKYLPPKYHIYTYFFKDGIFRNTGLMVQGHVKNMLTLESDITPMIEMSFPPYGYVLTIGRTASDERLAEISHFANYSYNEFKVITMKMTALPTHLMFAGDYRDKQEILDAVKKSSDGKCG